MIQLVKFIAKHVWEADIKKIQAREAVATEQAIERKVSCVKNMIDVLSLCFFLKMASELITHTYLTVLNYT